LDTATGFQALFSNTTGNNNTATGAVALFSNSTGEFNNAVGANSLLFNEDGDSNNALGEEALFNNISASANTAVGDIALANNDSTGAGLGNANTAVGASALFSNVDGNSNDAVGFNSLGANVDGLFNNVMGFDAMADNVNGSGNVAIGDSAGAGVDGSFNIYIGAFAAPPSGSENETIRIGDVFNTACFIGGISGVPVTGDPVVVDANGKLGILTSSARFKDDIKPMDKASEAILALKPVTFRYKKEIDTKGIPQFGLVAEEVAKVNSGLVIRDKEGKPYTVRYEAVNAMLLNEFLKEHKKTEKLEATVASLIATVKEQAAQIQIVSAQLRRANLHRRWSTIPKSRACPNKTRQHLHNQPSRFKAWRLFVLRVTLTAL
jgi:hypothetical protein